MRTEQNGTEDAHGIMFHHFHDKKHLKGQGAISADQFENIIEYYGDRLLSAQDWFNKARTNSLNNKEVCLTFDDALLCQYDIALRVLEKYNLTAFWFVYSSVLSGEVESLEVYRKFRTAYFPNIDDFYSHFFFTLNETGYRNEVESSLRNYSHEDWGHFPFYSRNDTKFRHIRDTALGVDKYNHVMELIMRDYDIDVNDFSSDLWMGVEHIQELDSKGHIVGLHSHTHPTQLVNLSVSEQEKEYQDNYRFLCGLLGSKPKTVSHPCNSYDNQTLSILRNLGVEIGFRANMEKHFFSELEFPREDHANVIRRIEQ